MLIRSKNDRVLVEISGSQAEKASSVLLQAFDCWRKNRDHWKAQEGSDMGEMLEFTRLVISKTLKDVKGLERPDGSSYRLRIRGRLDLSRLPGRFDESRDQ
jgi:hypothetical protein